MALEQTCHNNIQSSEDILLNSSNMCSHTEKPPVSVKSKDYQQHLELILTLKTFC